MKMIPLHRHTPDLEDGEIYEEMSDEISMLVDGDINVTSNAPVKETRDIDSIRELVE
jgi:hypothetical protein